jgi:hypothetical protein
MMRARWLYLALLFVLRGTSARERDKVPTGAAAKGDAIRLARWPDDSWISVFRYSWLDPSESRKNPQLFLRDLAEALRHGGKLEEVSREVKKQFQNRTALHPKLSFYDYYPETLRDLLLGGKK